MFEIIDKFKRFMIYAILVSMTVSPAFALGAGARNLMLIVIMGLSPIVILIHPKLYPKDTPLILLCLLLVLSPMLYNGGTMRLSTVMYGMMFCLCFMAYNRLLHEGMMTICNYEKVLKWLIYACAITLVIQQFCVLTGLPIFNVSHENYYTSQPWKLNSLTSEPSHSVRYMALVMYCYIVVRETITEKKYSFIEGVKEDKWIWCAFLWTMITSVSATAYLFLLIIMSKFVTLKNIAITSILFIVLFFVALQSENEAISRMARTAEATITLNETAIIEADHSGSARIVPMIIAAKMIDLSKKEGWFGRGVDYISTVMYKLFPGVPEGYVSGGILILAVEYGFIAFMIFLLFTFNTTVIKQDIITLFFWFFMCLNEGLNVQITWAAIIFLYTNKIMIKNKLYESRGTNG